MIILTFIMSCSSEDDQPRNPLEQLPPATQTGEQTFGCLVNGEAFLPDNFGRGRPTAFYQFVGGRYFLGIHIRNSSSSSIRSVSIFANDILIEEGKTYYFSGEDFNNPAFFADYLVGGGLEAYFQTTSSTTGSIFISKYDPENYIISGTFEYTAKEQTTNEIVRVTNGRFDVVYTN